MEHTPNPVIINSQSHSLNPSISIKEKKKDQFQSDKENYKKCWMKKNKNNNSNHSNQKKFLWQSNNHCTKKLQMTICVEEKRLRRIQYKWPNRMRNHSHSTREKGSLLVGNIGKKERNLFFKLKQSHGMYMWNCLNKWNKMKLLKEKNVSLNMHMNWQWIPKCLLAWKCMNARNKDNPNPLNTTTLKYNIKPNQFPISRDSMVHSWNHWTVKNNKCVPPTPNHSISKNHTNPSKDPI